MNIMSKIQSLTHKLQFFHRLPCMHSKDFSISIIPAYIQLTKLSTIIICTLRTITNVYYVYNVYNVYYCLSHSMRSHALQLNKISMGKNKGVSKTLQFSAKQLHISD